MQTKKKEVWNNAGPMPLSIESLDIEITSRCNLKCPYCYLGQGELNGKVMGDMSEETMDEALDLIQKFGYPKEYEITDPQTKRKTKGMPTKITFYGGEPMIAFDKVKQFVEKAEARGMRLKYSLLTNGTLGDERQAWWLKRRNIWVQRSIDGCPEVQEKYRPGTLEAYSKQTDIFRDQSQTRRMTVRPEFAKDILDSMKYFEWRGFEFGGSPMPDFYCEWKEEHVQDFIKSLWAITNEYLRRWKQGKAFYNYYLTREMNCRFAVPYRNTQVGCGGGKGLYCVSWDGWLYLCHRFSKEPHDSGVCYGSLKEVLAGKAKGWGKDEQDCINAAIRREAYPQCRGCIGAYGCEKGCMHNNIKCTGDIRKPPELYCRLRQEAAHMVTFLDMQLRGEDPDWWLQNNHSEAAKNYVRRKGKQNISGKRECSCKQGGDLNDRQSNNVC